MKQLFSRRKLRPIQRAPRHGLCRPSAVPAFAEPKQASGKPSPIHLGLATYTFRNFTRAQMIG